MAGFPSSGGGLMSHSIDSIFLHSFLEHKAWELYSHESITSPSFFRMASYSECDFNTQDSGNINIQNTAVTKRGSQNDKSTEYSYWLSFAVKCLKWNKRCSPLHGISPGRYPRHLFRQVPTASLQVGTCFSYHHDGG